MPPSSNLLVNLNEVQEEAVGHLQRELLGKGLYEDTRHCGLKAVAGSGSQEGEEMSDKAKGLEPATWANGPEGCERAEGGAERLG